MPRLLHLLDIGGTDPADDGHEMIRNVGLRRRGLDVGRQGLPDLLAVGAVVDDDRHALLRQPGDLVWSDLAAHQSSVVKLADHSDLIWLRRPSPRSIRNN